MKYYSADFLKREGFASEAQLARFPQAAINVRFCRGCPYFVEDYWQEDPEDYIDGWCDRLSYTNTFQDESPWYVYVCSKDFCRIPDGGIGT